MKKTDLVNKRLFKDNLYDVCNLHTGDHIATVVANSENDACDLLGGGENIVAGSVFENKLNYGDLREYLNDGDIDIREIIKAPHELLQDLLGEDYSVQPTFSNEHHTEYIVLDSGMVLAFMINSTDYNVFDVISSGNFFASRYMVGYWLDFLKLCNDIRDLVYCDKNGKFDDEDE